jgi:hypothetical protein
VYIKKSLILSLFLCLIVPSAYASNIGRAVYGVLAESATGARFDAAASDLDSVIFEFWNDEWTGWQNTMKADPETSGAIEGLAYTRLTFLNPKTCGWGASVIRSSNSNGYKNMSAYHNGKVKFLAKVSSANSNAIKCKVGIILNGGNYYVGTLENLGLTSAKLDQWVELSFNLNESANANFTEANLATTNALIIFMQDSNVSTNLFFDVDYIRWVKPNTTGSFNVTVKNVSGNSTVNTSTVTWASNTFQNGWKIAEQYLEIDYDKDSSTKDWNVRLFVKNGSKDRDGLYATKGGKEFKMTMCWRATDQVLPYSDGYGNHTYQIAEGEATSPEGEKYHYLYDSGSSSTTDPVWLYMQDATVLKTAKDIDYSTVMGYTTGGYHARSGVYNGGYGSNGYLAGSKVALYLGANCGDAVGGLKYMGNILVVLEYE